MNHPPETLLTLFPSRDPYENLVREELLFETFQPVRQHLLLYINSPCVVVGKNQNPWRECKVGKLREDGLPLVRRISGGGTVWHDVGNLNFSLLTSPENYSKERVQGLLGGVLDTLGIPWSANSHGDFFFQEKKFSGHAYAVKKDRILHHGTLLVSADLVRLKGYLGGLGNIEGPGVPSRPSPVVNLSQARPGLTVEEVVEAFRLNFPQDYAPQESGDYPTRLALRKDQEWILGQTPDFTWKGPSGDVRVTAGRDPQGQWFSPDLGNT